MSDGSNKGFWMSAALHGSVAAAVFLFGVVLKSNEADEAKVFELVAGEGDNFGAREAPALGSPGGVKMEIPEPPAPKPSPPEPAPPEAAPPAPVPPPPAPKAVTPPTKAPEQNVPNFKNQIVRQVIKAESRAKRDIAKERAAEKKRLEEEAKKEKLTKEEFDRKNKAKGGPTQVAKAGPTKAPKVDAEGIAKGVVGGSTANKDGGAGGKALKTDNDDVLGAYFAMFKQRLRTEFIAPPGLSDSLKATIEVVSHPDGRISGARVKISSGSREFDQAVLEAIARVRMPARPDKKTETVELVFTMRERNEG